MSFTISKTRQNLFQLADIAALGDNVEFTHKGRKFFLVAEETPSKLSRLQPMDILAPGFAIEDIDTALKQTHDESMAAWLQREA